MFGFGKKETKLDKVTMVSVFPSIGFAVLKVEDKLVVFAPQYLLGKHGQGTQQIGSKFLELKTAKQLLEALRAYVKPGILVGDRVEIKEADVGVYVGYDSLVKLTPELSAVVAREEVRGSQINVIYTKQEKIPKTRLMNFILVKFNPQYGQGVDQLFKAKYGDVGFEDFTDVYAVLTMFPGKYAPSFQDEKFWNQHALLKPLK